MVGVRARLRLCFPETGGGRKRVGLAPVMDQGGDRNVRGGGGRRKLGREGGGGWGEKGHCSQKETGDLDVAGVCEGLLTVGSPW